MAKKKAVKKKKTAKKKVTPKKKKGKKAPATARAKAGKKKSAKSKSSKAKKTKKSRRKKKKGANFMGLIIAVLIIAAVIVVAKTKGGDPLKMIKADKIGEWSATGEKSGKLNSPRGLAISPDNHLFVADLKNNRIAEFRLNGEPVAVFGKEGKGKGEFKEPSGVAVDKDGNIYVADSGNGRIEKFNSAGKYMTEIGGAKGGFYSPRNVAVNEYGIVYVADTGTSRIHRFDTEFHRLGKPFGGRGKSFGKFSEVFGLAFDSQKRVYVGDPGNRRATVLSSDLRSLDQIKVKGWENVAPMWPHVAVDSRDYLYCVSSGTQEIWVYDTKNPKFKYVGTIKMDKKNKPLFSNPLGIAIDKDNFVYISEVSKGTIVKVRPEFN